MDDSIDDDLHDLYADVEVQARTAISSIASFAIPNTRLKQDYNTELDQEFVEKCPKRDPILDTGGFNHANGCDNSHCSRYKPVGRTIQVENSIVERPPTMELRRPRTCDTDVVIQINLQDSTESPTTGKEKIQYLNITGRKLLVRKDGVVDDRQQVHYLDAAERDETLTGTLERFTRSSQPVVECDKGYLHTVDRRNEISDVDRYHHQEARVQIAKHLTEAAKPLKKTEEGIFKNPCMPASCATPEMSASVLSLCSPTTSYCGSDSGTSVDKSCAIRREFFSPLRRLTSGTESSAIWNFSCSNVMKNPGASLKSSRHRIKTNGRMKHQKVIQSNDKPGMHLYNEYDASRIYRDKLSHDCGRQAERLRENCRYQRQKNLLQNHYSEKSVDNVQAAYLDRNSGNYYHAFEDEKKSLAKREGDADYFNDSAIAVDRQYVLNHHGYEVLSPDGMSPLDVKQSRQFVSGYNFKEKDNQWRDLQSDIRNYQGSHLIDHRIWDELVHDKRGQFRSFMYSRKECVDEQCERHDWSLLQDKYERFNPFISPRKNRADEQIERDVCSISRQYNLNVRRDDVGQHTGFGKLWLIEAEDKHRNLEDMVSFTDLQRRHDDVLLSRRHVPDTALQKRQKCDQKGWDGDWCSSRNNTVPVKPSVVHPGNEAHLERNKVGFEFWVPQQSHEESNVRCQEDACHVLGTFCSGRIVNQPRSHGDYISVSRQKLSDMPFDDDGFGKIRKEVRGNSFNRSCNMFSSGEHEPWVGRCIRPVDLVAGKEKLARSSRHLKNGTSMCNNKVEVDKKLICEQANFKQKYKGHVGKAAQTGIHNGDHISYDEKWCGKFANLEQKEDLDIEEGEIMTEESKMDTNLGENKVYNSTQRDCAKKTPTNSRLASGDNETVGTYDRRLLEILAKMEKRRERFKDPVIVKKQREEMICRQVDTASDYDAIKQGRPARKRRWIGN